MEKRPQKTLAHTLTGETCARLFLSLLLFIPALGASHLLPQEPAFELPVPLPPAPEPLTAAPPKQLLKIHAILTSHRPDIAPDESWRWAEVILEESSKRHLDPLLVLALIRVESNFRPWAISPKGARGMMQIMPKTGKFIARSLADEYGLHAAAFTPEALDDPVLNLRFGIYYLHNMRNKFQDLHLALTAYNVGPSETQSRIDNDLEISEDFAGLVLDAFGHYKRGRAPVL